MVRDPKYRAKFELDSKDHEKPIKGFENRSTRERLTGR